MSVQTPKKSCPDGPRHNTFSLHVAAETSRARQTDPLCASIHRKLNVAACSKASPRSWPVTATVNHQCRRTRCRWGIPRLARGQCVAQRSTDMVAALPAVVATSAEGQTSYLPLGRHVRWAQCLNKRKKQCSIWLAALHPTGNVQCTATTWPVEPEAGAACFGTPHAPVVSRQNEKPQAPKANTKQRMQRGCHNVAPLCSARSQDT